MKKGDWSLGAIALALGLGGAAAYLTLTARAQGPATTLIITCDPTILVGDDEMADGNLLSGGVGVANKTVIITITKPDGTFSTANATTDINGAFSIVYTPNIAGQYVVAGNFAGDAGYRPATAIAGFTAIASTAAQCCRAVGSNLFDGVTGAQVGLIGIQDTTVDAWQMGIINGTYEGYRYSNHNYPNYPVPGSLNSDADCKIPSNSYKEFWFKNFWITRNSLGGAIRSQGSTNPPITGTTHLNHYRIQNGDAWSRDIRYNAFKNHRAEVNAAMKDVLDMALVNGIYINFTIGGGGSEASSALGAGPMFVPGTVAFNVYAQYCADLINAYGGHPAIACFDLCNEPVNYNGDGHDIVGRSAWWDTRYGRAIRPAGASYAGYEEWEARYLEWKDALLLTVKSKITLNPKPLLCIGGGNYNIFWATWPGHEQAVVDREKRRTLDYAANNDLIVTHGYSQAEYNDNAAWNSQTQNYVNKPMYAEEYGFAEQAAPWRYSYWPWFDLRCQQYGIDQCTMVLAGLPDPHPVGAPDIVPQPAYPGYPIPQSQMDAATAAWNAYVASH